MRSKKPKMYPSRSGSYAEPFKPSRKLASAMLVGMARSTAFRPTPDPVSEIPAAIRDTFGT